MTAETAIKILSFDRRNDERVIEGTSKYALKKMPILVNHFEAYNMAIEALEKQIAKVPIYSDYDEDDDGEELIPYKATCPTCGYEFEFGTWNEEENHHCVCGQKMRWDAE